MLYIFDKTLVLSIICGKCGIDNDRIFKEEESREIIYKNLLLVQNIMNKSFKYL